MFKRKRTYFYCYMKQCGETLTFNNGFVTLSRRINTIDAYQKVKEKIAADIAVEAEQVVIISLQKV